MHPDATQKLSRYHKQLFALLCVATIFEGFDTKLSSLLLPLLGDEFDAGPERLSQALAVLGFGSIVAFPVIRLADRVGRRPLMLIAVGGYALLTLLTTFSGSLAQFAAIQFAAKTLLVTQLAIAYVILSEELPSRLRGRANGFLGAFASVGAALPAVFLAPLEETTLGWRGLFLLGALPLLLLPIFWRVLRETPAFLARRPGKESMLAQGRTLLSGGLRRRFIGVTLLWFTVSFSSMCTMFFFSYYVFNERGWTPKDLQIVVPAAVPFAFLGYAAGGRLADLIGRRGAAATFLLLATLVANIGYRSEEWTVIAGSWVALQMLQGIWPIANTITAELFPTEVRATAGAFAHNLLGRWAFVIGPPIVGGLAAAIGSMGDAVALLALSNLVLVPLALWLLPETRGVDIGAIGYEGAGTTADD